MSGSQRVFKARIKSTQSLKKIFRAMELIAASRIGKARARVNATVPYANALTNAVVAVATHSGTDHPLTSERSDTNRVAVLLVTSDRALAGAYSASAIREAESLIVRLTEEGKEVILYVTGRRGIAFYQFRGRELAGQWSGFSDAPTVEVSNEISQTLLDSFLAKVEDGGVSALHVVYTQFVNMVVQRPRVVRLMPLAVVEEVTEEETEPLPFYDFEPSAEEVLDELLPRYVRSRIYSFMLEASASELAARQTAMHTATDNAEDIIRKYTRLANSARQAEITQEITEIVSGADALIS